MRKKFKSRLKPFALAVAFSLITFLGMNEKAFATQAPPSGTPENAPVSSTYSSTATALTSSLITF